MIEQLTSSFVNCDSLRRAYVQRKASRNQNFNLFVCAWAAAVADSVLKLTYWQSKKKEENAPIIIICKWVFVACLSYQVVNSNSLELALDSHWTLFELASLKCTYFFLEAQSFDTLERTLSKPAKEDKTKQNKKTEDRQQVCLLFSFFFIFFFFVFVFCLFVAVGFIHAEAAVNTRDVVRSFRSAKLSHNLNAVAAAADNKMQRSYLYAHTQALALTHTT